MNSINGIWNFYKLYQYKYIIKEKNIKKVLGTIVVIYLLVNASILFG